VVYGEQVNGGADGAGGLKEAFTGASGTAEEIDGGDFRGRGWHG
jgi:hypothetical protein